MSRGCFNTSCWRSFKEVSGVPLEMCCSTRSLVSVKLLKSNGKEVSVIPQSAGVRVTVLLEFP
jgi:hypothetical protein